jgi:hypothetical protein
MSDERATIQAIPFLPEGKKARGYLIGMVLAAAPIFLVCLYHSFFKADLRWLFLGIVAVFVSWFPLRLLSIQERTWLTLSDVFVFVALFQFGVEVAVVIASVEALSFNLRRRPQRAYRWIFNVSQIVLVAFLVGQLFHILHVALTRPGQPDGGTLMLPLVAPWLCGFVYYGLSSGLTGLALAFSCRQPFTQVWMRNLSWYSVSITGAVMAALTYFLLGSFVPLS